jgi:ATP-binding cassette, subfamily B, bacterial
MPASILEPLPDPIEARIEELLDDGEQPQVSVATDMDAHGHFGGAWLVATPRRLLIVTPDAQAEAASLRGGSSPPLSRRGRNKHPLGKSGSQRAPSKAGRARPPLRGRKPAEAAAEPGALPPELAADPEAITILQVPLETVAQVKTRDYVGSGVLEVTLTEMEHGNEPVGTMEVLRYSRSLADKFSQVAEDLEGMIERQGLGVRGEGSGKVSLRDGLTLDPSPLTPASDRCPTCGRPLPKGSDLCPRCIDRRAVMLRLVGYLRPYIPQASLSLGLAVAMTAAQLAPPLLMKVLIDDVLTPHKHLHLLWMVVGALGILHVIRTAMVAWRSWLNGWLGQSIVFDLRTQIYRHLQKLSLSFYDKRQVGSVLSRVTSDTSTLHGFLVSGVQSVIINVLTILGIGVIMFGLDWRMALVVMVPTPILAVATVVFINRIRRVYRRYWGEWSGINGFLASTISGVRVVKSFGQEDREVQNFTNRSQRFMNISLTATRLNAIYSPSVTLLTSIGSVVIWAIGGRQVLQGHMLLGTLTAFTAYMWQFYQPIMALCDLNETLQQSVTAAERVFEVLDTRPEVKDSPGAEPLAIKGRIDFDHVGFRYQESDSPDPVLSDISFSVEPGELVGIVGHSGSGKTTLVNLLLRFYDVTEGSIQIDGRDLRKIQSRCLREQISMVLQEPFLFTGSIANNIAYGRPNASRASIIEAAKAANAHKFIMSFPDGYDTEVGERGVKLSGGEKQRISIARAILNNPRILILDEATSAVDTETEALIQQAMDRLLCGRTALAIAHRLSTLKNASKLIVLDKGKLVELGTHEELMAKEDGIYAHLVKIQTELTRAPEEREAVEE